MANPLMVNDRIECGAVFTAQHRGGVRRLAAFEAGGVDSMCAGDHISFRDSSPAIADVLSFVAGAAEQGKIGSNVYLLPLRHPTAAEVV